jgi:acetyl esterase/lipase
MPADKIPASRSVDGSRRALLTGLAGLGAVSGAGCADVEFLLANLPARLGAYRRHADVAYGPGRQQRLDVYVPDRVAREPCAVVVFWHGGRWEEGDKGDYLFVGAALAGLGCVAVLPNYRHYPEVRMAGFMQDAALAAAWAARHAREYRDTGRLFLMGHSAGAHLAALVSLDLRYFAALEAPPPSIAGIVGLSGPYDFLPLLEEDLQDMFGPPERYPLSQPISFVRADAPPMLLVHGGRDMTVLPKNSRNFAAALQACGAPASLLMYPRLGHADTVAALSEPARWRAPVLAEIAAFVAQLS